MSKKHDLIVKGGRLRLRCEKCKNVRYYTISPRIRKKTVRCHCGKVVHCTLNRRNHRRESCAMQATVIINMSRSISVILCNVSDMGIGFNVTKAARIFKIGQKVTIEYRLLLGKRNIRKANIANIATNYVGVKYTDRLLQ